MSEHKNLHAALCAVQAAVGTLPKDGTNPHFRSKFTPLDTIVERTGPLLAEHGLTWSTFPCFGPSGEPALRYKLTHAPSGESEEDVMPLLVQKLDPQGQGSGITYARRYSLTSVLNLVADEDDDGNSASKRQQASGAATNGHGAAPVAAPVEQTQRAATAKQRGLIFAKASEANMPASVLANIVLVSMGAELRDFETEEAAQAYLTRALDRVPAAKVDVILKNILAEAMP